MNADLFDRRAQAYEATPNAAVKTAELRNQQDGGDL